MLRKIISVILATAMTVEIPTGLSASTNVTTAVSDIIENSSTYGSTGCAYTGSCHPKPHKYIDQIQQTTKAATSEHQAVKGPCFSWDSTCVRPPPQPRPTCYSWDSTCVRPPPQPRPTCYSWDSTCVKPFAAQVDTPLRRKTRGRTKTSLVKLESTYGGGDTGSSSGGGVSVGPCWSTKSGCVPEVTPANKKTSRGYLRKKT